MTRVVVLFLWIALTAVFSATRHTVPHAPRNVFGDANNPAVRDHRILYTDWKAKKGTEPEKAWRAVGRIFALDTEQQTSLTGTATLVGTDPATNCDVVLTAGHCILDSNLQTITDRIYFVPNMQGMPNDLSGAAVLKEILAIGSENPIADRSNDWALVRLDRKLGDTYGYIPVAESMPADVLTNLEITLIGYSTDIHRGEFATIHSGDGCKCVDILNGRLIRHSCDNTKGASGAPMLANIPNEGIKIVALNVASFHDTNGQLPAKGTPFRLDIANVAVRVEKFVKKLAPYVNKGK